jgi:hypothetical protein
MPRKKAPIAVLYNALGAAEKGTMPPFTPDSFVESLGLEGDDPDGKVLAERFAGGAWLSIGVLRSLVFLKKRVQTLIAATNEYVANPAQEAVAQSLGAVVTRQLTREGDVCPFAMGMALASTRSDLIPEEVRQSLAAPDAKQIAQTFA